MTLVVLAVLGLIIFDVFTRPRDTSSPKTLDLTPMLQKRKRW